MFCAVSLSLNYSHFFICKCGCTCIHSSAQTAQTGLLLSWQNIYDNFCSSRSSLKIQVCRYWIFSCWFLLILNLSDRSTKSYISHECTMYFRLCKWGCLLVCSMISNRFSWFNDIQEIFVIHECVFSGESQTRATAQGCDIWPWGQIETAARSSAQSQHWNEWLAKATDSQSESAHCLHLRDASKYLHHSTAFMFQTGLFHSLQHSLKIGTLWRRNLVLNGTQFQEAKWHFFHQ